MESTSAWRTHKGAWGCCATIVSCLQVRLWIGGGLAHRRKSAARLQGHAALKTVEGPPAPPLFKGEIEMFYQKFKKLTVFLCRRTLGRAMRRKACRLALAEALSLFSLSYCVAKTINSVNFCLQCPVFNASGLAMCRPQWFARRWAGWHAERRIAWPWRRR